MEQIGALIVAEASDWRGTLTKGLANHNNIISKHFGTVTTIGTGADSIIEQVQRLDNNYDLGMFQPQGAETRFPEFRTLALNLQLLANVYWREFTMASNIFDAWGGAYDLIYQDSNKVFQFLDEYTIFLRLFDVDQDEKGIQPMNVLKYQRRPDISFITMLNNDKLDFFGAKDITASDEPIEVRLDREDISMNSKVHISIIAVGRGNRFLSPIIQIDGLDPVKKSKQTVFTWFNEEERLCIAFNAKHDEWLREQAMAYYRRYANNLPQ